MKQRVKLVRLSLCECGHPVLNADVALGTEYVLDTDRERSGGGYSCGGCGVLIHSGLAWAESRNGGRPGYLPSGIFEPADEWPEVVG